ncbi:hypothetical protein O1611_g7362 [Lasiodiplodia mahajangana]|uniref:Uncharacterized protein n=1 Tax=Lasiodiplodia mahajangana TaxID=1108764 RepID=A0ACC2JFI9_9PEZI|nr:hypothetical protein O1611_g7362 [Lasiodiplodia mahajangana]
MSSTTQSPGSAIPSSGSRWAVVVGIDHYGDKNNLQGCVNDAILVSDYMLDHLKTPEDHIFLHIAENEDWEPWGRVNRRLEATPAAVKASLKAVMERCEATIEDSFVHVHFSGHGAIHSTVFRKGSDFERQRKDLLFTRLWRLVLPFLVISQPWRPVLEDLFWETCFKSLF